MRTRARKIIMMLLIITFAGSNSLLLADTDCDGCKRAGRFEECTVYDPMGSVIPKDVTQPSGDYWEDVTQPSGEYSSGLKAVCSSMKSCLSMLFLPDCFGILGGGKVEGLRKKAEELGWPEANIPKNYKQPEYSFDVDFVSGLENQFREGDNRPIVSRLKVSMYFEGEQREPVHDWEVEGTLDPVSGKSNDLSVLQGKLRRAYKEGPSITEIIDEFEKRPYECQMKLEEDVVKLGQVIEIELSDFRDAVGEQSREFNRVMLQALHGKILNGMPSKYSDDLRIFPIGKEPIKIKYQAPDSCEVPVDSLVINSTCEILDDEREPYKDTEIDVEIQTEAIPLYCPGVFAIITVTQKKSIHKDDQKRGKIDRHDWNETTSITIRVDFEKEPAEIRQSFDMATMTSAPDRYRYKPAKWTITQSSHNGSGKTYQKREGIAGLEFLYQSSALETGAFSNLVPAGGMMTINVDPSTGKAHSISIPAFDADIEKTTSSKCQKKERKTVDGSETLVTDDCSDTWNHPGGIHIGGGPDECWKIKGGDGETSLSGDCINRVDRDNGYTEFTFRWNVNIIPVSK